MGYRDLSYYHDHYTLLRDACFSIMLHGIRWDNEAAKEKVKEIEAKKIALKQSIFEVTGTPLWSVTYHRSPLLLGLLEEQRRLKAEYREIPKADKKGRKEFKHQVDEIADQLRGLRGTDDARINEIGTGLSDDKIKKYLYNTLKIPPYKKINKSNRKMALTADDITLKKICNKFPQHVALCKLIMEHRKCNKLMGYLDEAKVDSDGRMRTMLKTYGTQSSRLSSSSNPRGTGMNLQNLDRSLKGLMIPDEG